MKVFFILLYDQNKLFGADCFTPARLCSGMKNDTETQLETQVVHLMSPLTIRSPNAPSIRTQWGLKERSCLTGWPCLTGISCVWHVVPKGRDLFSSFFPLFFSVCVFFNLSIIRPVKDIWHYVSLNLSPNNYIEHNALGLKRWNCFIGKVLCCLWSRPNNWNVSPKVLPQTFSPDVSG